MEKRRQRGSVIGMVIALCIAALCVWLIWVSAVGEMRRTAQGAVLVDHSQSGKGWVQA